jgi:putative membrane protein
MNVPFQATLNATLNLISGIFLLMGYINIKRGRADRHKQFMIAALISSTCFLTSYVIYHARAGSVPYQHHDWTRPLYFGILIPHVTLAAAMVPFIILAVRHAFRGDFVRHTRITRKLWPVWMFVSVSGVIVYLMLYHL